MFYNDIKKPKVGQTFYMVGKENGIAYIKKMFIEKVITSKLTETDIDFRSEYCGYDKEKCVHVNKQWIHREKRNHYIVETRCKEIIDFSTNERISQKSNIMLEKVFFDKGKALNYFNIINRNLNYFFLMDESSNINIK
jgi:hypothetical protein